MSLFGKILHDLGEPGQHHLPRPVDIGSILEIDVHRREAEGGGGPNVGDFWKTEHGGFDRVGDESLHLLGRHAVALGVDLDEGGGGVGEDVYRQLPERDHPQHHDEYGCRDHEVPLFDRESDQTLNHVVSCLRYRRWPWYTVP